MNDEEFNRLKDYIISFQPSCDRFLSRLTTPQDKNVLIIGSGWGTEILWSARNNASDIVGVDPGCRSTEPLDRALRQMGLQAEYRVFQQTTHELDGFDGYFDLIVSHNVFEHIMDVPSTLLSLRRLMKRNGRVAVFADPLYYSSCGAHLPVEPWEHLYESDENIKVRVPQWRFNEYINGLNRKVFTDFLMDIREAGMIALDLFTVTDRNLKKLASNLPRIREAAPDIKPFDLCIEGFGVLMCYPENL